MQTGVTAKAGAAFLAGVLVALSGAIIYLKTVDSRSRPAIQVTAVSEPAPGVPDLAPSPKPVETPTPAAASEEKKSPAIAPEIPPKPHFYKPKPTRRPVSLAVWRPKAEPVQLASAQDIPTSVSPEPQIQTPAALQQNPPSFSPPAPVPAPPQPHTVTIPAGTNIAIRLGERLSTEHNYTGDTFRAALETPIIMDGFIIADHGAKVLGHIVKAQKPGKFEGIAELQITLTQIDTTDGQQMHVQTNNSIRKGPSNTNEELLKMGGVAALGAIIGAIADGGKGAAIGAGAGGAAGTGAVLLGHGKPAIIETETKLTFTLSAPTTLTEKLN